MEGEVMVASQNVPILKSGDVAAEAWIVVLNIVWVLQTVVERGERGWGEVCIPGRRAWTGVHDTS